MLQRKEEKNGKKNLILGKKKILANIFFPLNKFWSFGPKKNS